MKVNFYEQVDDKLLKFAVIISKHNGYFASIKTEAHMKFPEDTENQTRR